MTSPSTESGRIGQPFDGSADFAPATPARRAADYLESLKIAIRVQNPQIFDAAIENLAEIAANGLDCKAIAHELSDILIEDRIDANLRSELSVHESPRGAVFTALAGIAYQMQCFALALPAARHLVDSGTRDPELVAEVIAGLPSFYCEETAADLVSLFRSALRTEFQAPEERRQTAIAQIMESAGGIFEEHQAPGFKGLLVETLSSASIQRWTLDTIYSLSFRAAGLVPDILEAMGKTQDLNQFSVYLQALGYIGPEARPAIPTIRTCCADFCSRSGILPASLSVNLRECLGRIGGSAAVAEL